MEQHLSATGYTATAKILHWLMAVLIIGTFTLGLTMVEIPGITPTKLKYFNWHKWAGVTVLLLATLRLLWRLTHPAPPLPTAMPGWQKKLAELTHCLLYFCIFAVPLSGYFYSLASGFKVVYLGLVPLPVLIGPDPELKELLKTVHYIGNITLCTLVTMHVGAALQHHFIHRDGVLRRMLPQSR
jgi:cytochrome b561